MTFSGDKFRAAFVDREEKFLIQRRDLDAVNARRECEMAKVIFSFFTLYSHFFIFLIA